MFKDSLDVDLFMIYDFMIYDL